MHERSSCTGRGSLQGQQRRKEGKVLRVDLGALRSPSRGHGLPSPPSRVEGKNVATTLALADQHHCDFLKGACIEFISSATMDNIVATQGFMDLKRDCPAVLVDAFIKMSIIRKS
ncbi:hypothetical protein C2845_PM14G05700 [Panicum miliaceum]|uniref:BPM/SPOP BACK domain-containing protein n=1 Tax=Panicum miliaceum TaxID=4540 RepID=A0A3L6PN04_PANMI|nr:hypothetical protein C2845_PM14G05700 [Panicum miliaceum]